MLAVLTLVAWALYDTLHLERGQLVIAIVALVGAVAFVLSSVPGWNRLLAVAQDEPHARV